MIETLSMIRKQDDFDGKEALIERIKLAMSLMKGLLDDPYSIVDHSEGPKTKADKVESDLETI